jgi:hypothetical protein
MTTGDTEVFRVTGARFLQLPIGAVEHVPVAELERRAMTGLPLSLQETA